MGCHTWFSVPVISDEKKIRELAIKYLNTNDYMSQDHKIMYQLAIDNNLESVITELACDLNGHAQYDEKWTLYQDVTNYTIDRYNSLNPTINKVCCFDSNQNDWEEKGIETYSDEPRIDGYPDRIVTSYDDMVDFMKTGFTDSDGEHYDFYYDEDRIEGIMEGIKTFFIKHPKGIITFD